MSDRLPSGILVSALLRRVNDAGGFGVVRAKGDAQGGGILLLLVERGQPDKVVERGLGPTGTTVLIDSTPPDGTSDGIDAYLTRRRDRDPDLWIVEVDIAAAERFAAEVLLGN